MEFGSEGAELEEISELPLEEVEVSEQALEEISGEVLRWKECVVVLGICYMVIIRGLTMELLSPTAVMSEGLGFNLCVAPFLNICVLNLLQRVGDRVCQRWSELGWRSCTRVKWGKTELGRSEDEGY